MENYTRDIGRQMVQKLEEELEKIPPGWILCLHEAYDTLYEETHEAKYTITQHFHVIRNSEDCLVVGLKTQYGPKV